MTRAKAGGDQMTDKGFSAVESRCSSSEYAHGGDVYRNEVSLDFSVNLNPLGVPQEVISAAVNGLDEVTQYPDPYHTELRNAIAASENTDPDMIVCGNGASELIMAAVHAFMPRKALVTAPCYSGYETSLEAAGTEICHYYLDEKKDFTLDEGIMAYITEDIDMVFLTNPNNPNGRLIDDNLLQRIEHRCTECGTVLMLDECFLPLTGARTASGHSASNGAVTDVSQVDGGIMHLRAFTKTFAVPGIRLGYIFSSDTLLLNEIRLHLPEWNVSRAAEKAGAAACRMLTHSEYLDDAMRFHVFRYLSKPLDKQRLFRNLDDALKHYNNISLKIAIETKDSICTLSTTDIISVEARERKVIVHTVQQDFISIHNMNYWKECLPSGSFFQTHRSFIVNFLHIKEFDHSLVYLDKRLLTAYLTRRKYHPFKDAYLLYLENLR